jgi:hypothetical protein
MSAWMFSRDIWPDLQPGQPPPYTIDLVDEAGLQRPVKGGKEEYPNEVRWRVIQEGGPPTSASSQARMALGAAQLLCHPLEAVRRTNVPLAFSLIAGDATIDPFRIDPFIARTWVQYAETEDVFNFGFMIVPRTAPGQQAARLDFDRVKLRTLQSVYRINRAGHLLRMRVDLTFDVEFPGLARIPNVAINLEGQVHEDLFHPKVTARAPGLDLTLPFDPVPVSHSGSVLNPLHPVNRIKGLRPGQTWRMPMIDPLAESLSLSRRLLGRGEVRFLNGHVLPHPQMLVLDKEVRGQGGKAQVVQQGIPCLVIEYDDEETRPRTWVQVNTGLVLRQEVTQLGRRLALERDIIIRDP